MGPTVVAEYRVELDPEHVDPATERIVLVIPQPHRTHNGGWIGFGPLDGLLYVATGDGGIFCDSGAGHTPGTGNAQDLTDNLLGKILRIDPLRGDPYSIPPDNPFVGREGDDEIWCHGLRNPWRASFDRVTGDLWIADVGASAREEVDFQPGTSPGGENHGWRCAEGTLDGACGPTTGCGTTRTEPPLFEYAHAAPPPPASNVCAVVGGVVYRGSEVPALRGQYLFTDHCGHAIWSLTQVGGQRKALRDLTPVLSTSLEGFPIRRVASLGEDAAGEVYLLSLNGGVFRIVRRP